MKVISLFASFATFACLCKSVIVTTTLSPAQQTSAAIVDQEQALQDLVQDIFLSTSLLEDVNLNENYPTSLVSFMVDVYSYTGSDFPTSLFINEFPFSEFESIFNGLSWKDEFLSEHGMTTFKNPSDYAVLTITESLEPTTTESTSPSPVDTSTTNTPTQTTSLSLSTVDSTESLSSLSTDASTESYSSSTEVSTGLSSTTTGKTTFSVEPTTSETSSTSQTDHSIEYTETGNSAGMIAIPGTIAMLMIALI